MTEHKGLILHVYKSGTTDCTNGGVTATHDSLIVVGTKLHGQDWKPLEKDLQVFSPETYKTPAAILVESNLPGLYGPHLVPLELIENMPEGHVGPMSGGNYAGTADSRWEMLGTMFTGQRLELVPVHDRTETVEQYRWLSSD